jgi:hypothetical protein
MVWAYLLALIGNGMGYAYTHNKWQAAGAICVVRKAVLTLHPPLRPLSHNVNPRDGAQDIPESLSKFCSDEGEVLE